MTNMLIFENLLQVAGR